MKKTVTLVVIFMRILNYNKDAYLFPQGYDVSSYIPEKGIVGRSRTEEKFVKGPKIADFLSSVVSVSGDDLFSPLEGCESKRVKQAAPSSLGSVDSSTGDVIVEFRLIENFPFLFPPSAIYQNGILAYAFAQQINENLEKVNFPDLDSENYKKNLDIYFEIGYYIIDDLSRSMNKLREGEDLSKITIESILEKMNQHGDTLVRYSGIEDAERKIEKIKRSLGEYIGKNDFIKREVIRRIEPVLRELSECFPIIGESLFQKQNKAWRDHLKGRIQKP